MVGANRFTIDGQETQEQDRSHFKAHVDRSLSNIIRLLDFLFSLVIFT